MRLFWDLKIILSSLLLTCSTFLFGQDQPSTIEDFKHKKVFYADIGYNTSPFNIVYPFNDQTNVLKFKNNFKTFLGLGFAYKWFNLRIGFPVIGYVKPIDQWGESQQFNLGLNFSVKNLFFDFDFKTVQGYAIKDYYEIDSSSASSSDNRIIPSVGITNFSLNGWYFHSRNFKMSALRGLQAHYNQPVQTWYIKGSVNVFGVDNNGKAIIPPVFIDDVESKTQATVFSAFDFGVIPGYAYVTRIKNWQFSGWLGLGGVIQSKFYILPGQTRGFIGLAPRYDVRFIGGYTDDKYFVFLVSEFDNKSIRFIDLKYRQYFYSVRISAGIRIGKQPD